VHLLTLVGLSVQLKGDAGRQFCSRSCQERDAATHEGPRDADQPPPDKKNGVVDGKASAYSEKAWREWALRTEPEEAPEEDEEPSTRVKTVDDNEEDDEADMPDPLPPVDAPFLKLQERLRWYPAQVLRYYRIPGANVSPPLWVNEEGTPGTDDVAPCPLCGGPRTCEFQVSGRGRYRILLG
jgi:hypothetical protein